MRRRREQALSVFGGCKVLAAPELAIAKEDEEIEAKADGGKVVGIPPYEEGDHKGEGYTGYMT